MFWPLITWTIALSRMVSKITMWKKYCIQLYFTNALYLMSCSLISVLKTNLTLIGSIWNWRILAHIYKTWIKFPHTYKEKKRHRVIKIKIAQTKLCPWRAMQTVIKANVIINGILQTFPYASRKHSTATTENGICNTPKHLRLCVRLVMKTRKQNENL